MPSILADRRNSGVLLPVFSLPGGCAGDFGPCARGFVDRLSAAHQSWWQMLPLGPTTTRLGNSPYSSMSTRALDAVYLSVADLVEEGLVVDGESRDAGESGEWVDYEAARSRGARAVAAAARRLGPDLQRERDRFRHAEREWLDDWALFAALRDTLPDPSWVTWPAGLRDRDPAGLDEARQQLREPIEREVTCQFLLHRQWQRLRSHAHDRGVRLFGDLPIYVPGDSCDVWTERQAFALDAAGRPVWESGVPPDGYAADGQKWDSPVYDWEALARQDYAWWKRRLAQNLDRFDLLRLDHFRGFSAYWRIPAGRPASEGSWQPSPGYALFGALSSEIDFARLVAEDLGTIDAPVLELLRATGLPGMRVIQFGLADDDAWPHLPENIGADVVAYTGTHDNDTLLGWLEDLPPARRAIVLQRAGHHDHRAATRALIESVFACRACLAVVPLQDVLGLDGRARINRPGRAHGSWRWRASAEQVADDGWVELLKEWTLRSGRSPALFDAQATLRS